MTTLNNSMLNDSALAAIRQRRSAGENLARLANEVGLTWQRLWTLLYPAPNATSSTNSSADTPPVLRKAAAGGSLVERYRPTTLDAIFGQAQVVKVLRKFAGNPYSTAFVGSMNVLGKSWRRNGIRDSAFGFS